jgi:hypothetical protein
MGAALLAPEVPPSQGYSKAFARPGGQAEQAARQAETFGLAGPARFVIVDAVGIHRKKARNGPKTFFDLAPKQRARELAGLAKLLKSEITSKILTKWAAATGATATTNCGAEYRRLKHNTRLALRSTA